MSITDAPSGPRGPHIIRRTAAAFPVRRMPDSFDGTDHRGMWDENPVLSDFLGGISLFFAPGEHFMIRAVRSIMDDVEDPQVRADVDAFLRQEAQHATTHARLNSAIARRAGSDDPLEMCREVIALWDLVERFGTPRQQAALTAAQEHVIASVAEVLASDGWLIPRARLRRRRTSHPIDGFGPYRRVRGFSPTTYVRFGPAGRLA
jgi:predicted metal-dependent hydrolase